MTTTQILNTQVQPSLISKSTANTKAQKVEATTAEGDEGKTSG